MKPRNLGDIVTPVIINQINARKYRFSSTGTPSSTTELLHIYGGISIQMVLFSLAALHLCGGSSILIILFSMAACNTTPAVQESSAQIASLVNPELS